MKRTKKDPLDNSATPVPPPPRTSAPKPEPAELEAATTGTEPPRRLHLYFSGTVQGVGFRYSAQSIAERFGITGWVRNCSDGRVEVLAESAPNVLENYLTALGDEMSAYIRKVDRTWEEATGEFKDFAIASSGG